MTQRNSVVARQTPAVCRPGGLQPRSRQISSAGLLVASLFWCAGCVTPWEREALLGSRTSIDNVQGPTERSVRNFLRTRQQQQDPLDETGSLKPIPGTDEFLAAEELYEQGDYQAAEKAFHKLARKSRPPHVWTYDLVTGNLNKNRPPANSPIREDALFMQAESAYQQKHFADAYDGYAELLRDYPSTRHLDGVTRRLFEIARLWLDFPKEVNLQEVAQVNYDDFHRKLPAENPEPRKRTPVFVPNFIDEERPLFDTEGNAISALRLIWLNDPTGPLADDALMMTASHYARRSNWIEADRYFTLLREEYPNSPHVQTAFVLGSHVKLMSYEGAAYDGKTLEDAQHLKESTLRLYPASEDRKRLEHELERIEEAKADRLWQLVEFYGGKRNRRSEAVYCHLILERFPDSSFADRARKRLQELGPEYATGSALLKPVDDPPKSIWAEPGSAFRRRQTAETVDNSSNGQKPATGLFRRRSAPSSEDAPPEPQPVTDETEEAPKRRWFGSRNDANDAPAAGADDEPLGDDPDAEKPEGGRLGRLFRFTPPKRLAPNDEAQPNAGNADDGDDNSGKARL